MTYHLVQNNGDCMDSRSEPQQLINHIAGVDVCVAVRARTRIEGSFNLFYRHLIVISKLRLGILIEQREGS